MTKRNASTSPPTRRRVCLATVVSEIPREYNYCHCSASHSKRSFADIPRNTDESPTPTMIPLCSHKYVPTSYINVMFMCDDLTSDDRYRFFFYVVHWSVAVQYYDTLRPPPPNIHCSGGFKFYCLDFIAVVSGEMCPATIPHHRHCCNVWGPLHAFFEMFYGVTCTSIAYTLRRPIAAEKNSNKHCLSIQNSKLWFILQKIVVKCH